MYDDVARRAQRGGGGALTALTPASCVRAGSSRRPAVLPLLTFGNPCLWGGGVKWSFTPTTHPTVLGTADPAA